MIKKEEVKKIADLSRLNLSDEEILQMQEEISSILDYFELLKEVNVSEVSPMFYPHKSFSKGDLGEIREDKEENIEKEDLKEIINSFPEKENRHAKVKEIF